MTKKLKKFLPLIVGILVLLILVGARVWKLSLIPKGGRWPEVAGGTYETPVMKDGANYFVPPDELYANGMGKDGIPALNSPTYVTVAAADDVLADNVGGIDVEVAGKHRFYSFQVLNWHELVNDKFGDKELLISYSPLCGSAVVYDRVVEDGITRVFGDNGQVYNNCAVLYDDKSTEIWDQASGQLLAGHDHATSLTRYPSAVMTWAEWKTANPNGEVLSTETGFTRDYRRHPYGAYDNNTDLYFPVNKTDARLSTKDIIQDYVFADGVHVGASAKFIAFVKTPNYTEGDVNFTAFENSANIVSLFNRTVDGQTLSFVRENNEIKDNETDSRWNTEGVCIKGKLKGKKLTMILPTARYFAFAYVSHLPKATLLGSEIFDAANKPAEKTTSTEPTTINVTP